MQSGGWGGDEYTLINLALDKEGTGSPLNTPFGVLVIHPSRKWLDRGLLSI